MVLRFKYNERALTTVDETYCTFFIWRRGSSSLIFRTDHQRWRFKDGRQEMRGEGRKGWSEKSWGWEVEMEEGRWNSRVWGTRKLDKHWACLGKWDFSNLLSLCSFQERPLGQDEIDGKSLLRCPSMLAPHCCPLLHFCKFFHVRIPFPPPAKCNLCSSFSVILGSVNRVSVSFAWVWGTKKWCKF